MTTVLALAIGAAGVGFAIAFGATPVTSHLARRFGILDIPDEGGHKTHAAATPYLGGVAIFTGLLAAPVLLLTVPGIAGSPLVPKLVAGVAIALALGLVGLIDDVRGLSRIVRLGAQIGAAYGAWYVGFRVSSLPLDWGNVVLTLFWFVGITNAFNLLDNMDGLSAGVAGVAATSFAVMGITGGLVTLSVVAAALAGAAFGFLGHNRHPAKIFMGDAGSTFLGFLLALIGISLRFENLPTVTFIVPVVVLGVPIFDTTLVVLSRWRHGRGVFEGGRDHTSHRLVSIGLPVKTAVGLLYWGGLCLGWLGLIISRANSQVAWLTVGFVVAVGTFFGSLLWKVPVYEDQSGPVAVTQEPVDLVALLERDAK